MAWTSQYKRKQKTLTQRVAELEKKVARKTISKPTLKAYRYKPSYNKLTQYRRRLY